MTDNSTDANVDMNNFDDFKTNFFNPTEENEASAEQNEEAEVEEVEENEDESLATENEDEGHEDDESEAEDQDDEDEVEEPEQKQKPKSKAQKRIEQLYADKKQQEREIAAMRAELDRLRTVTEGKNETKEEES